MNTITVELPYSLIIKGLTITVSMVDDEYKVVARYDNRTYTTYEDDLQYAIDCITRWIGMDIFEAANPQ